MFKDKKEWKKGGKVGRRGEGRKGRREDTEKLKEKERLARGLKSEKGIDIKKILRRYSKIYLPLVYLKYIQFTITHFSLICTEHILL